MNSNAKKSDLQTSPDGFRRTVFQDCFTKSQNLNTQEVAIEDENIPMIQSFEKSWRVDLRAIGEPQTPISIIKDKSDDNLLAFINHTDGLPWPTTKTCQNTRAHDSLRLPYDRADETDLQAVRNSLEFYLGSGSCRQVTNDRETEYSPTTYETHSHTEEVIGTSIPQTLTSISIMSFTPPLPQNSNITSGSDNCRRRDADNTSRSTSTLKDAYTQTVSSTDFAECATQTEGIVPSRGDSRELLRVSADKYAPVVSHKTRRSARLRKSVSI